MRQYSGQGGITKPPFRLISEKVVGGASLPEDCGIMQIGDGGAAVPGCRVSTGAVRRAPPSFLLCDGDDVGDGGAEVRMALRRAPPDQSWDDDGRRKGDGGAAVLGCRSTSLAVRRAPPSF